MATIIAHHEHPLPSVPVQRSSCLLPLRNSAVSPRGEAFPLRKCLSSLIQVRFNLNQCFLIFSFSKPSTNHKLVASLPSNIQKELENMNRLLIKQNIYCLQ